MSRSAVTVATLKRYLKRCGYTGSRLAESYRFDSQTVPLAGFVGRPWDARSACIAAVEAKPDSKGAAKACLGLGAPTVLAFDDTGIDWWKLSATGPSEPRRIMPAELDTFFQRHRQDLSPKAIYSAKLRRPTRSDQQMWFVDVGLMPMVEREAGQALDRLVNTVIQGLVDNLRRTVKTRKDSLDIYKSVFWLLAARILHDKDVDKFKRIDLLNVEDVFARVGRHYADTEDLPPGGRAWRPAVHAAAKTIAQSGHWGNLSTESLAYLYETTLIDKKRHKTGQKAKDRAPNVRRELGIHSTPSVLVDHMLAQLWPLIEQIQPQDRRVFEPACGHAGFLVAAMRWLRMFSELEGDAERHRYLSDRLFGLELDPFAVEIAKLSLTLADAPHGNSWTIQEGDMFEPRRLPENAGRCTILLANPPFERFTPDAKRAYRQLGAPVLAQTKAAEMLRRTIPRLAPGAVFGVVVPQGVLHDKESQAQALRKFLVEECELTEISLFADNLFEYSDQETAILLGRTKAKKPATGSLWYRRVREDGMDAFKERMAFSSEQRVPQPRFTAAPKYDLRVPELDAVWHNLQGNPRLESLADVGRGLEYHGRHLPDDKWTTLPYRRGIGAAGFTEVPRDLAIFGLPQRVSMNLDREVIRRPVTGTTIGVAQVLVNYAPVSREAWRLKGVIDMQGHAVTSRFLTIRPKDKGIPMALLWAILNSPVANAFAFCNSSKRETLAGTLRELPVPQASSMKTSAVLHAANAYLQLANREHGFMQVTPSPGAIRSALLRMDAEVLRLYDLPPRLERQLLDLFQGVERKGAACDFRGYYPEGMDAYVPLHELISEEYQRSTLDAFLDRHKPTDSPEVLAALRAAANAYAEE